MCTNIYYGLGNLTIVAKINVEDFGYYQENYILKKKELQHPQFFFYSRLTSTVSWISSAMHELDPASAIRKKVDTASLTAEKHNAVDKLHNDHRVNIFRLMQRYQQSCWTTDFQLYAWPTWDHISNPISIDPGSSYQKEEGNNHRNSVKFHMFPSQR